jgi:hypothetical protein
MMYGALAADDFLASLLVKGHIFEGCDGGVLCHILPADPKVEFMTQSVDHPPTSRLRVPQLFKDPAANHLSAYRRVWGYGALICFGLSVGLWGSLAAAERAAFANDRFTLSPVRQDSVLRVFALSEDFSSELLSIRASSSERGSEVVRPLISPLRDERASDLVGSLEKAEASALDLTWAAHLSKRVMKAGTSQPLMVIFRPSANAIKDSMSVRVSVNYDPLEFTLSPQQTSKEILIRRGEQMGSTSWILRPMKSGSHSIAIEALGDVQAMGITVRTIFGLPPWLAGVIGAVTSILTFVFSLPWFFDFWREHQRRRNNPLGRRRNRDGPPSIPPSRELKPG